MGTLTTPALNLREMLARVRGLERRASSDLVRVDFTNLVTNGDFSTTLSPWLDGSLGTGTATVNGSNQLEIYRLDSSNVGMAYQEVSTFIGAKYKVTITEVADGSSFQAGTTSTASEFYNSSIDAGTSSLSFVTTTTNTFVKIRGVSDATTSTYDDVSIYEADPSDDAPWLRLPYGFKVGTRGMIVRDGVVLHPSDYTEITNAGQTFIKPITAPGVSTEFSIWAGA